MVFIAALSLIIVDLLIYMIPVKSRLPTTALAKNGPAVRLIAMALPSQVFAPSLAVAATWEAHAFIIGLCAAAPRLILVGQLRIKFSVCLLCCLGNLAADGLPVIVQVLLTAASGAALIMKASVQITDVFGCLIRRRGAPWPDLPRLPGRAAGRGICFFGVNRRTFCKFYGAVPAVTGLPVV